MAEPRLTGFRHSVYTRIARMALAACEISHDYKEADPFRAPDDPGLSPVGRVPVLTTRDGAIYETLAICLWADRTDPAGLLPDDPLTAARAMQVASLLNAHGYWPMVRQVFAHRVYRPIEGAMADEAEIRAGLAAAAPVLGALDAVASEGRVLSEGTTLAEIFAAPMLDYFTRAPEGAAAVAACPALARWWAGWADHPLMAATDPGLARPGPRR